jgi:hypothetical protein
VVESTTLIKSFATQRFFPILYHVEKDFFLSRGIYPGYYKRGNHKILTGALPLKTLFLRLETYDFVLFNLIRNKIIRIAKHYLEHENISVLFVFLPLNSLKKQFFFKFSKKIVLTIKNYSGLKGKHFEKTVFGKKYLLPQYFWTYFESK